MLLVYFLCSNLFLDIELARGFRLTEVSWWILILVVLLYAIIIRIKMFYRLSLRVIIVLLSLILRTRSIWVFYFMYEIIFIFIIFSIIILGYRFERLSALYLIIFYSFLFSSPCLAIFLVRENIFLIKNWLIYDICILYFLIASFMVKFPIFGFHYWLPVAHVEASTLGRILLAGILLKIGGVGIYYMVIYYRVIVKFHWLVLSVLFVRILILRLRDLKSIIAYSSIAHISIVFYVLNIGRFIAKKGVLIIIFYHGFISPIIFWIIGRLGWWKTRSLLVLKLLSFSYSFLLIVFFISIINIGFPPFIGFLRELLLLKSLVNLQWVIIIAVARVLLRCYYNIYYCWAFISQRGWVRKFRVRRIDVYLFVILVVFLNFY